MHRLHFVSLRAVCLSTVGLRCVAVACTSMVQSLTSYRSSPGLCGISGGQNGSGTSWSPLQILQFSPVCIIPPTLRTHPSISDAVHSNLCNWQRRYIRPRHSQWWLYLPNFFLVTAHFCNLANILVTHTYVLWPPHLPNKSECNESC